MGMSIEEKAIKTLNEIIDEGWLISDMEKCTAIDVCEFAIDRIHKYQKIEQIVSDFKDYQKAFNVDFGGDMYMQMVNEVVEDGKID